MKFRKLFFGLIILVTVFDASGQSKVSPKLSRRNPDGWFSLLVPMPAGKVERHADVDGGFYSTDAIEIDYDFWTYEGTPNFLRDVLGKYSKAPHLACPESRKPVTIRTKIDGKRALIQRCSESDEQRGSYYVYYVTFPKVKVFDGENFDYGMFNLTIRHKRKAYSSVAEQIVRSIYFKN